MLKDTAYRTADGAEQSPPAPLLNLSLLFNCVALCYSIYADTHTHTHTHTLTHSHTRIYILKVGTAAACEANQGSSSSGLGSLDFGGTPFVIKSGWKLAGNAVFGSHVFSASRGSVRLEGGGYCGGIEPDAFNEWAPEPTRWSIELEAASTAAGTPKLKWLHRKNE